MNFFSSFRSNSRRESLAKNSQKLKSSNIPVLHDSRSKGKLQKKVSIFNTSPSEKSMSFRHIGKDILSSSKRVDSSENVSSLYMSLRSNCQGIFNPSFFKIMFPQGLSVKKQLYLSKQPSKIPSKRKSTLSKNEISSSIEAKNINVDLMPIFDEFRGMMKTQRNDLFNITDILLLYCAMILILFSDGEVDEQLQTLYFLKQFLQIDLPKRPDEAHVLMLVLTRKNSNPSARGHSIQALAFLAQYSQELIPRIQACSNHTDVELASICKETLKILNINASNNVRTSMSSSFARIPSTASVSGVIEVLNSYLNSLLNQEVPPDTIDFIKDIIFVMHKFIDSPTVLEKGSHCLQNSLHLLNPIPIEIVSEILNLCYSLLSGETFLSGTESFEAVESVQSLTDSIFDNVPSDIILSAVAATIAVTTDVRLPLLLERLSIYYQENKNNINQRQLFEISSSLDAFHPNYKAKPHFLPQLSELESKYLSLAESIEKLLDPDTVFTEMENIINHNPQNINNYPLYLRGFLQRAYYLYHNAEPEGMSSDQRELAQLMVQEYNSITPLDLEEGGKYGIDVLTAELDEIQSINAPSW